MIKKLNSSSKKKVLTVSNYYPPDAVGGAEITAHCTAREFMRKGTFNVCVFSSDLGGKYPAGTVRISSFENIPVFRVSLDGSTYHSYSANFKNETAEKAFSELCRDLRPDIVHFHNLLGLSVALIDIAKDSGAGVFITLHDYWGFCPLSTAVSKTWAACTDASRCTECLGSLESEEGPVSTDIRRSVFKAAFNKADALISPSVYLAERYISAGFPKEKITVIANGLDTRYFRPCRKERTGKLRIAYAGYFGRHKGISTLIKAVSLTGDKNISILLAGDGEEEEQYVKLSKLWGISDQLCFYGKLDNRGTLKLYNDADIYCLPSIWPENRPVSITEAMACGLPVIASDIGGVKELVHDNETGLLFHAGDPHGLADSIIKLRDDPKLRRRMGKHGRKSIKRYDIKKQAEIIAREYLKYL